MTQWRKGLNILVTAAPGEGKTDAYIETLDLAGWIKAMAFAAKPRAPP